MTLSQDSADVTPPAPPPPPTFDAIPLTAETRRAVDEMGFVTPTPVQVAAFGPAVEGRDLIVQARTGTGKTAAFGLPLVDRIVTVDGGVQALILAPTRELALQSTREIEKLGAHRGIRTAAVYGGAPMERQVRELAGGAQIVSGTPGRVLDHLRRGTLDARRLRVLVLDEADEMLSMGFAKELHAILEELPKTRQTFFFSATIDDDVKRLADRHMKEPLLLALSGDAVGAQGIAHFVYHVTGLDRTRDLIRILEVENPESALVFCNTKVATERVAQALQAAGYDADWLNGDLAQSDREKVMARTRDRSLRFLVSTDVAARGIDVSHLTHVINYELPETAEQYVHRTGRTGRAGRTGTAISLVAPREIGSLYYLRLQYRIFPVERSLPSSAEERTRREADRLGMLVDAFVGEPRDVDRAVARRVLTHIGAERIVAGMIGSFFGAQTGDVDEQAAAARRTAKAEPVPEPVSSDRGPRPDRADRGPRRSRERPEPRERESRDAAPGRDRERPPRPSRDTLDLRTTTRMQRQRPETAPEAAPETMRAADDEDRPTIPPSPATEPPPRAEREDATSPAIEAPRPAAPTGHASRTDAAMLFINVGRRDGVRPGEIVKLLAGAGLARELIGRIRIRDKHTFVGVPHDAVDKLVTALGGTTFLERTLVVELSKAGDE